VGGGSIGVGADAVVVFEGWEDARVLFDVEEEGGREV
jgi:hypothetical protein